MTIGDIVILILLAFGAIEGFRFGVIKKLTDFIGLFAIIILSFYLKNYLSVIMYENLPFFKLGGFVNGIDVINILIYEVIAFLVIFCILLVVLKLLVKISGFIERILKATIILSIPSKILGIFAGILEMYVYIFIFLVITTLPLFDFPLIKESTFANKILNNSPILSPISEKTTFVYDSVYDIVKDRENKSNTEINTEVLKFLIDEKVITKKSAKKLVDENKISINDKSIIEEG